MGEGAYIAPSARKHGIGDQDMLHALTHPLRVFDLDDGFAMLVAADTAGRLLDVGVVEGDTALGHRPRHARPPEVPEVMIMPRTVQDIVDHCDKLAKRFEDYEPRSSDARPPEAFVALRRAAVEGARAEGLLQQAVNQARHDGYSWRSIGSLLGTSGEAARQRYGTKQEA